MNQPSDSDALALVGTLRRPDQEALKQNFTLARATHGQRTDGAASYSASTLEAGIIFGATRV